MGLLDGILHKMFPPLPQRIGALEPGAMVTVRGTVVPRDVMDSPLTGVPCVYYRYTIEKLRHSHLGGDPFWDTLDRDEAILEFYVDDDDRAIVAPHSARVSQPRNAKPKHIELGVDRRARELLIVPGDSIEVTAEVTMARDLFDEGRGYREPPDRLMLRAPDQGVLHIRLLAPDRDDP